MAPTDTSGNDPAAVALHNLTRAIDRDKSFPDNVFVSEWDRFFFFDSDWIVDGAFVRNVQALLTAENSSCACLVDLSGDGTFIIGKQTTTASYVSLLNGQSIDDGWIYKMGRLACTSDVGHWCIYCEQRSEIAVFALRRSCPLQPYHLFLSEVHALPISKALDCSLSYGFSRALLPEWREGLLTHYAATA